MYSLVSLFVLGHLASSMGLPVEEPVDPQDLLSSVRYDSKDSDSGRYNPQDFHASWRHASQESPGRIVGGWDASESDAPHMAAIVMGGILTSLVCGGLLMTDKCIVTAGHCIEPLISWDNPGTLMSTARGQIGSTLLSSGYQVVEFSHFLIHPEYDRVFIKNDVGILWLTEKLPKNSLAQPIAPSFKRIGGGVRLSVTGFGRLNDDVTVVDPRNVEQDYTAWGALPDRLQKLQVYSMSHAECKQGIQEARDELGFAPDVDELVELCTMHPHGYGKGMCNGDSGSALWLEKPDRRRVAVALVSWGFPCARGYPDVHGRMSGFKEFLVPALKLSASDYEE